MLKAENDRTKNERDELSDLVEIMALDNKEQAEQVNEMTSEIHAVKDENEQLRTEVQQLKVSQ